MNRTGGNVRTRWAAIGAAVAITLGGGGIGVVGAAVSSGDKPVFVSIKPQRILDTRSNLGLAGKFGDAAPRDLQVTGSVPVAGGGSTTVVPAGATGVALNVTVVAANTDGFLSVRPSGATGEPQTSNVNFVAGQIVPNAVNVDLPANGRVQIWFEAWTNGGTGDVLVDVVGYYDDHTHDDRYYTEPEVNSLLATQPWSVSMPIASAYWFESSPSMAWEQGGGGAQAPVGLSMDDSGFSRFYHGFTLPPTYQPGSDVNVRMTWAADATNPQGCGFVMEINGLRRFRAGAPIMLLDQSWAAPPNPSFPDRVVLSAPASPGSGNGYQATVQDAIVVVPGENLQPGDRVDLALNRDQDETGDTCTGKIVLLALDATPA